MEDMINHPKHYASSSGLEAIDVIDAFTEGLNGFEAAYTANILKYMCRWKNKNGVEDLKKARWYLNRMIDRLEIPKASGTIDADTAIQNIINSHMLRSTAQTKEEQHV